MFCKHCGAQNDDDAKFCSVCGGALEAPVEQPATQPVQTAPAQPAEPAPTGLKKIFYLVGAICSFLAIVLSFGLFFAGGVSVNGGGMSMSILKTTDFFSEEGFWKIIIDSLQMENGYTHVLGSLLSAVVAFAGIISLFVYFIIGIVKFVKAVKGTDYRGVTNTAIKAFGTFTVTMLLILSLNAASEGGAITGLNPAALAGVILGALLIGANIVLHFVGSLKDNLGLKKLLKLGCTVLVLVVGVIIAALAAGPLFKVEGNGTNFFAEFLSLIPFADAVPTEKLVYVLLGFVSGIILISLGVDLIKQMMTNALDQVDGKETKKSGLALTITTFIFGLVLVVATYLYADGAPVDGAASIVIMVFSLLASAGIIVRNKLLGK